MSGESGNAKEIVARSLHAESGRGHLSFVAINSAAVPTELLESELFGHVKGAFTNAKADRSRLFAHAAGGTLLLDEIGHMPMEMQPKLLRVLQESGGATRRWQQKVLGIDRRTCTASSIGTNKLPNEQNGRSISLGHITPAGGRSRLPGQGAQLAQWLSDKATRNTPHSRRLPRLAPSNG